MKRYNHRRKYPGTKPWPAGFMIASHFKQFLTRVQQHEGCNHDGSIEDTLASLLGNDMMFQTIPEAPGAAA
ncbi:hypothetical protein TNIN_159001 [Trichonephila inaurata madagascariensis]|uniref:Uncharacterized protein n=1 Tax=Trichonephila inaurata madagascariensis TaxID=2747483 RepID=A0A8X6IH00_9ARAC|nr:hypothetical protein TNIN_159001 [Trichonephila inaurata madagascariensis]